MRNARAHALFALLAVSIAAAGSLSAAESPDKAGIQAITRPSGDRVLSFVRQGLIMEMSVDKGDPVKKDQMVAKQDDREEVELLKVAQSEAESETEINAEKAVLDADKFELQKKTQSGSEMEKREAALKVVVDEARIKLAIDKKRTAEFKYAANKAALEKLKLISPIDGVVQEVFMRVGEAPNGQELKVMRVIQVDPLWVETPVPIRDARKLNPGDPVNVLFTDGKLRTGKVALKDRMADAASGTLNIRVEVPNPEKLEPGESVRVHFGPAAVAESGR
jgi:RND family efflux transporter MFP subunit